MRESKAVDPEALCIIAGEKVNVFDVSANKMKCGRCGQLDVTYMWWIMEEIFWIVQVLQQWLHYVIFEDLQQRFQEKK